MIKRFKIDKFNKFQQTEFTEEICSSLRYQTEIVLDKERTLHDRHYPREMMEAFSEKSQLSRSDQLVLFQEHKLGNTDASWFCADITKLPKKM